MAVAKGPAVRLLAAVIVGIAGFGSCSSDNTAQTENGQDADTTLAASGTSPVTEPTTATTTTTSEPQASDTAANSSPPIRAIAVEGVEGAWSEPDFLGSIDSLAFGVVPGSQKVVHFERTGPVVEGCEGGEQPLHRLVLTDFVTGDRTVLVEELEETDSVVRIGPAGQFAILGACDANGWLAVLGSIDDNGSFQMQRLDESLEDRIGFGGNAGVSLTWTADGTVIYLNSTRVNASTGELLDVFDPDAPLRVHAELADGFRLASSTRSLGGETPFWLIGPNDTLDSVPIQTPLLAGQADYPAAEVQISADGQRVLVTVDQWSFSERTYVVGGDEVLQVEGAARLSADGSRLLVRTGLDEVAWTVVDLDTGTGFPVPVPGEAEWHREIRWGGDGSRLLISAFDPGPRSEAAVDLWLVELG